MHNPFTDFIMPKNKGRFLGKGQYAHSAKLTLLKELLRLLRKNPTTKIRHKTPYTSS